MYIHKLPNAAASKIAVTNTATTLESLIATAASATFEFNQENAFFIHVEDGNIRMLMDGNTPTATNGVLLTEGEKYYFPNIPIHNVTLIRTGGSNVACSVQVGRSDVGESAVLGGTGPSTISGTINVDTEFATATENAAAATTGPQIMGRYDATPRTLGDGDAGSVALDAAGRMYAVMVDDNGDPIAIDGFGNMGATVSGNVGHDAADSGNPVKVGGVARTSNPSAVASGDRVDAFYDDVGRQVTVPVQTRDLIDSQETTITSSISETTIVTAGGAGVFNDLIALIITNTSATDTEITIRDATLGTVIMVVSAPANDTRGISLNVPLPQATANNNWTAQCADSVASIRIMAQYAINV